MAAPMTDPFVPAIYQIGAVRQELADTVTLTLLPQDGHRPAFTPGQFNMLYAFGVGEAAISISGDPAQPEGFVHTIRAVGAISKALAHMKPDMMVGVRGPFGVGWPVEAAHGADVVIVAGGLGLAPLRPVIYAIMAQREKFGRVSILIGSRHPDDLLYPDEIAQWRQRLDVDILITVDHADAAWRGHVGVVPDLVRRADFDPADTIAMVCGPEVMMRFTTNALTLAGVPADRIHVSLERNMKCAIGLCGHCQFGPDFVCKDGPVVPFDRIARIFSVREA